MADSTSDKYAKGKSEAENRADLVLMAGIAAAVLLLLVAIPTIIGAAIWWPLRHRIRRIEGVIALVTGLVGMVIAWPAAAGPYGQWLMALIGGGDRLDLPYLALGLGSLAMFGLCAALYRTPVATMAATKLGRRAPDSLIPTASERKVTSVVRPPPQSLVVDATVHDIADPSQVGNRDFPIGVDRKGTPFSLHENEIKTHGVILGATGSGKALALDTPLPTPTGWTTMGALSVGDLVLDDLGLPTRVTFATQVQHDRDCFALRLSDGTEIVADAEHRWVASLGQGPMTLVTTAEMAAALGTASGAEAWTIAPCAPLEVGQEPSGPAHRMGEAGAAALNVEARDPSASLDPGLLRADASTRAATLAGLVEVLDTSPSPARPDRKAEVTTVSCASRQLAAQVAELHRSLGGLASVSPASSHDEGDVEAKSYIVTLNPVGHAAHTVVEISPVESVPVRCITVDSPSHLYLAGEAMVPTHNTETIKTLAGALLDIGYSVILLDLKEDTGVGGLRDFCDDYAASHAIGYQEIALSDPNPKFWFNPLYGMSTDEAINTLVSLQEFDDGYWQAINRRMVGQLCTLFYDAHRVDPQRFPPPDMLAIGRVVSKGSLASATKEMRAAVLTSMPGRTKADFEILSEPGADDQRSAGGLGARIVNTYESDAGRQVLRAAPGREVLDVTRSGLTYIGLNTLGLSELARVVSTSVLLRVATFAGARTTGAAAVNPQSRIAVIIDEANFIDRIHVQNLLSRCRSAGISVWLCTQGPLDWEEDWPKITTNINVAVVMRQGNQEAAELAADLIGKQKRVTLSNQVRDGQVTDSGSLREEIDYVVSPEELRELRIGEAIVSVAVPDPRRKWVKVVQRPPTSRARMERGANPIPFRQ